MILILIFFYFCLGRFFKDLFVLCICICVPKLYICIILCVGTFGGQKKRKSDPLELELQVELQVPCGVLSVPYNSILYPHHYALFHSPIFKELRQKSELNPSCSITGDSYVFLYSSAKKNMSNHSE